MGFKQLMIFLLVTFSSWACLAQDEGEKISTDRPGFTDAVEAVPKGTVQIETGVFANGGRLPQRNQFQIHYNTTSVRLGLFESTELRIMSGVYQSYLQYDNDAIESLLVDNNPLRIGLKSELIKGKEFTPSLAFSSHVNIPWNSGILMPDMQFVFSYPVDNEITIVSMMGLHWLTPEHTTFTWTFKIGTSLSESWSLFGELYGDRNSLTTSQSIDGGFTWTKNGNFQLDFGGGLGMSREAHDWYGSFGLSLMLEQLLKCTKE